MAVYGDTKASVREVISAESGLPVLLDTDNTVANAYQVQGVPTAVYVDSKGRIATFVEGGQTAEEIAQAAGRLE